MFSSTQNKTDTVGGYIVWVLSYITNVFGELTAIDSFSYLISFVIPNLDEMEFKGPTYLDRFSFWGFVLCSSFVLLFSVVLVGFFTVEHMFINAYPADPC